MSKEMETNMKKEREYRFPTLHSMIERSIVKVLIEKEKICPNCNAKKCRLSKQISPTKREYFCKKCKKTYEKETTKEEMEDIAQEVREVILEEKLLTLKDKGMVKGSLEEGFSLTERGISDAKNFLKEHDEKVKN